MPEPFTTWAVAVPEEAGVATSALNVLCSGPDMALPARPHNTRVLDSDITPRFRLRQPIGKTQHRPDLFRADKRQCQQCARHRVDGAVDQRQHVVDRAGEHVQHALYFVEHTRTFDPRLGRLPDERDPGTQGVDGAAPGGGGGS